MSGIGAIIRRDGGSVDKDIIGRVANSLQMYGRQTPVTRQFGNAAFACSIFLETPESLFEKQPVMGGQGNFLMLFDGRVDNRDELIAELGIDSSRSLTIPDSRVAMLAWERWGESALLTMTGAFAIIIWDNQNECLVAARDPLGSRTLYFHECADFAIVASAPRCIHATGLVPRLIDNQKISDALCQFNNDVERSFFEGVKRIKPGGIARFYNQRSVIKKYYNLADFISPIRLKDDAEYVATASSLFDQSIRATVRSEKNVGALVSGGLDSTSMAVVAAQHLDSQGKHLETFTSVPEREWDGHVPAKTYGDERPYVEAALERYTSIKPHFLQGNGLGHYHKQEELLFALEMPVRNALNLQWTHEALQAAQERGIGVMLQGVFGNATLSRSGDAILWTLLSRGNLKQLAEELRILKERGKSYGRMIVRHIIHPRMPSALWDLKERIRGRGNQQSWRNYSAANESFLTSAETSNRLSATGNLYPGDQPIFMRDAWVSHITNFMTEGGDIAQGLRALYGVDLRDPFADRRLVEWCLSIPEEQFYYNGIDRRLIKRMMAGRIPDMVLNNPLSGLQTPDWHLKLSRDLEQISKDLLVMSEDPELNSLLDIEWLKSLVDDFPSSTILNSKDKRLSQYMVVLPMALQIARFHQKVRGVNSL